MDPVKQLHFGRTERRLHAGGESIHSCLYRQLFAKVSVYLEMSTLLSLFFLSILAFKGVCEPLRSDNCRISETMVLLHFGDVHEVPICFPIVKHQNGEKWEDSRGKSMRYNRFKCEKHECALCRCDISRGYKLSNDSRNAECVMMCPITKHFSKRCFKVGTARMCTY